MNSQNNNPSENEELLEDTTSERHTFIIRFSEILRNQVYYIKQTAFCYSTDLYSNYLAYKALSTDWSKVKITSYPSKHSHNAKLERANSLTLRFTKIDMAALRALCTKTKLDLSTILYNTIKMDAAERNIGLLSKPKNIKTTMRVTEEMFDVISDIKDRRFAGKYQAYINHITSRILEKDWDNSSFQDAASFYGTGKTVNIVIPKEHASDIYSICDKYSVSLKMLYTTCILEDFSDDKKNVYMSPFRINLSAYQFSHETKTTIQNILLKYVPEKERIDILGPVIYDNACHIITILCSDLNETFINPNKRITVLKNKGMVLKDAIITQHCQFFINALESVARECYKAYNTEDNLL